MAFREVRVFEVAAPPRHPEPSSRWPTLDTSVANGTQRQVTVTFRPSTGAIVRGQSLVHNDLPASPLVVGLVGKGPSGFEVADADGPGLPS